MFKNILRPISSGLCMGIALCAGLQLFGCGGSHRHDVIEPVPDYMFPSRDDAQHLRLVSILTDPYGNDFHQGALASAGTDNEKGMIKPVAVAAGDGSDYYILDHGRGLIYYANYTDSGLLEQTVILPQGGRRLPSAVGLALAPDKKLWVVDSRLKALFRLDLSGKIVDSITGWFGRPVGIVYHPILKRLLVTDLEANSITFIDTSGRLMAVYGPETGLDVEGPSFIAVGPKGDIYVVEALTALVKVFDKDLKLRRVFGGQGDGPGYFARPKGIAVDEDQNVYVVDALFDNVQVFDRSGLLLLTLGTTGSGVGRFWQPTGIAVDSRQQILIADSYNRRVQVFCWENKE